MTTLIQCGNGGAAIASGNHGSQGGGGGGGSAGGGVGNPEEENSTQGLAGDGTHAGAPANIAEYAEMTGLPHNVAARHVSSVYKYTTEEGYGRMRAAQKRGETDTLDARQARNAEAFIRNSTPFQGEVHRGISLNSLDEVRGAFSQGGTFQTEALTSFSSRMRIAEGFADKGQREGRNHQVVMSVTNKSGASVNSLSRHRGEAEVLVASGTRYRVLSATTMGTAEQSLTYVSLQEY